MFEHVEAVASLAVSCKSWSGLPWVRSGGAVSFSLFKAATSSLGGQRFTNGRRVGSAIEEVIFHGGG